jgi:hypothetical protein
LNEVLIFRVIFKFAAFYCIFNSQFLIHQPVSKWAPSTKTQAVARNIKLSATRSNISVMRSITLSTRSRKSSSVCGRG